MPAGRKRQVANFERRTDQFVREIQLGRVEKDPRFGSLYVGRGISKGLIFKQKPNEFRLTAELTSQLKKFYSAYTPDHFVLVFPVHSQRHPVQEHFNAPTLYSLLVYLGYAHVTFQKRDRDRNPQRELCKNILNNTANKSLTTSRLIAAFTELRDSMRLVIGREIKYIHKSNVIVLGCTKDGKIRLAVIDAI